MAKDRSYADSLTLFDVEDVSKPKANDTDTSATLKWSFSKRGVLMQCPRKFYYQYYGAHRHKAKAEADKEMLRRLKMITNR